MSESTEKPGGPCVFVIFGAGGDLTKRKLLPALYNLRRHGLLAREVAIVGAGRIDGSRDEFRARMSADIREFATVEVEESIWKEFEDRIYVSPGMLEDPASYEALKTALAEIDKTHSTGGNFLFYLAVPPALFATVVKGLAGAGLLKEEGGSWRRVIIEKPFGRDLDSARELQAAIAPCLQEHQVYRIDHYLGKETVQNILVFRFGNGIFEPIWDRRYIEHVQITAAESVGVEGRGGYYETAGALRDMIQNHMFQLLTLVAMEPPSAYAANQVRDEKAKVLDAVRPMHPEEVLQNTVRGQYGAATIDGKEALGYRAEPKVAPDSRIGGIL